MLSGTSCDGVDAAVADLWYAGPDADEDGQAGGELLLRPRGLRSEPYPAALRAALADSLPPARIPLERVCRLDTELGQCFGAVAARAAAAAGGADLIASHGQTVHHWVEGPRARGTLQLGAPAWIAEATGLPVVSDLRTRDIARGGHGAPLAALLDALLLVPPGSRRGALNLGGIANLTVRGAGAEIVSYDLGPGNALLDALATEVSGGAERMDAGGARAGRGRVDPVLLDWLLAEPYYRLPPPKSTGKELFHAGYLRAHTHDRARHPDDVAATLTELTAELVAAACRSHRLAELVVSGGGVRNPVLMDRLRARSRGVQVATTDAHGLPAQAKEGYLFALLGFLTVHGLPGNVPGATGASGPAVLGSLTPGAGPLRLPPPAARPPARLRLVAP